MLEECVAGGEDYVAEAVLFAEDEEGVEKDFEGEAVADESGWGMALALCGGRGWFGCDSRSLWHSSIRKTIGRFTKSFGSTSISESFDSFESSDFFALPVTLIFACEASFLALVGISSGLLSFNFCSSLAFSSSNLAFGSYSHCESKVSPRLWNAMNDSAYIFEETRL